MQTALSSRNTIGNLLTTTIPSVFTLDAKNKCLGSRVSEGHNTAEKRGRRVGVGVSEHVLHLGETNTNTSTLSEHAGTNSTEYSGMPCP